MQYILYHKYQVLVGVCTPSTKAEIPEPQILCQKRN